VLDIEEGIMNAETHDYLPTDVKLLLKKLEDETRDYSAIGILTARRQELLAELASINAGLADLGAPPPPVPQDSGSLEPSREPVIAQLKLGKLKAHEQLVRKLAALNAKLAEIKGEPAPPARTPARILGFPVAENG